MNINPFQGDRPGEVLTYGWIPMLLTVILWFIASWLLKTFMPAFLAWFFATWMCLAFIGTMLNSPASNPNNRDRSWTD